MSGDCLCIVFPIIATQLPLSPLSILDQIVQYGILVYLLLFIIILFSSTIVGGPLPDNTVLLLIGAAAIDDNLSLVWLFIMATVGGFVGYEINYWSGRLFGLKICRSMCSTVLHDKNVRKALDMMDHFGPAALILSRFMPVLNLPSFISGVNAMDYRRFVGFNFISSAIWCGTLLVLGYYIGTIPIIIEYLDYITDLFIIILAIAIIIVLIKFALDYLKRPDNTSLK
jgi:membrane-associated protein